MFPDIIVWHCSNHRLELAVADVVEEVSATYGMKSFFDKLYSLYSASPKKQAELQECARALIRLNAVGRILGTRWVSSSARSVRAVWQNYAALVQHFENASKDTSRDSKQQAHAYKGLKDHLNDTSFALNMGLLFDALVKLEELQ
ncbi:UNVERIFIED_CONTAM: hypothetical protein FKN15_071320 [Acipenser sinensis]